MGLYNRINQIAKEKGVSIYKIEKETGLSNGSISKWNNHTPGSISLMKVASYLDVTVEDLLNEIKSKK